MYGFSIVMYGCESWTTKKADHSRYFQTAVLEETRESPLNCNEIKPVNPKRTQPGIFIKRVDVTAKATKL